eukprot:scaffold52817_cov56-Phaeocystis_antarctica.AAC.2
MTSSESRVGSTTISNRLLGMTPPNTTAESGHCTVSTSPGPPANCVRVESAPVCAPGIAIYRFFSPPRTKCHTAHPSGSRQEGWRASPRPSSDSAAQHAGATRWSAAPRSQLSVDRTQHTLMPLSKRAGTVERIHSRAGRAARRSGAACRCRTTKRWTGTRPIPATHPHGAGQATDLAGCLRSSGRTASWDVPTTLAAWIVRFWRLAAYGRAALRVPVDLRYSPSL